MRTLVVDDSSSMRALLGELLCERGHEVVAVASAEEALAAHTRAPFQLMVLDWTLPGLSGLELCRAVREAPGGRDVFILVVTGRNRSEDLQAVFDAGASDYLSKPIEPELFATRLMVAERAAADAKQRAIEHAEMESRLAFADRMTSVGTLTAGVAHELNNPLMYVLSNLHLTKEELESGTEAGWMQRVRQQLDEAIDGARRMQHIIRDLKAFSRVDDVQHGPSDVRGVLESSINICWNQIRHRATLERELGEVPAVDVSESRLGQVFLNLLINAVQAMPDRPPSDSRIVVRTYTDDDGSAVVEVIDNGVGILRDRFDQVFEPFFTTKRVSEGTGLGLSISRRIVRDAGGTIEVNSTPGNGSTFIVRLPPSTAEQIPTHEEPPATAPTAVRSRVIVVDDEPLVGRSIRRALRNHDVEIYSKGQQAIERLRSDDAFDLVFLDLMMPDVSGVDVYRQITERRPDLARRFVFMTGGAFTAEARDFLERHEVECLEKPFELGQIREMVAERARAAE